MKLKPLFCALARMIAALFVIFTLFALYVWQFRGESYCPWYPDIDTVYAKGFSKEKFLTIRIGMSKENVSSQLGEPFSKYRPHEHEGLEFWSYSHDGALGHWGDKAWISYVIVFQDDKVVGNCSWLYND